MKLKDVKKYREKRVWTQKSLASFADVSLPTIIAAEKGRSVQISTVHKIAQALGIEPGRLGG